MPRDLASRLRAVASRLPGVGAERSVEQMEQEHAQRLARGDHTLAREAYAARLAMADHLYAEGRHADAGEAFGQALTTAFDRKLHFDTGMSPLAADPAGFTAPLRKSVVARVVRGVSTATTGGAKASRRVSRRGSASSAAPQPKSQARSSTTEPDRSATEPDRSTTEPTRLLIAYRRNADFLGEVIEHFGSHPNFDTQVVDFEQMPGLMRFRKSPAAIVEQLLSGKKELGKAAERNFREHLDWADVVFVEWCTALAVLLTKIDPSGTRIVVRMHSYEAFSHWPHLVDWTKVDDVVFVSEHLRDLAVAAIPGLTEEDAPRLHVRTLAMDLRRMQLPKQDGARFVLALLGASKMVKDPRWAIEVLRVLRQHDERYRLFLIGGKFQDPSAATAGYAEAFQQDLAELELVGAVERIGFTDDVPGVLQRVGVIVSASVRESFHIGLVEGAASGAVPVVRDWPFFPGAARQLFPDEWVVDSPDEAAQRILETTADEATWRAAGQAATEHVVRAWDWSIAQMAWDELLTR